jgi:hypothetical protein
MGVVKNVQIIITYGNFSTGSPRGSNRGGGEKVCVEKKKSDWYIQIGIPGPHEGLSISP